MKWFSCSFKQVWYIYRKLRNRIGDIVNCIKRLIFWKQKFLKIFVLTFCLFNETRREVTNERTSLDIFDFLLLHCRSFSCACFLELRKVDKTVHRAWLERNIHRKGKADRRWRRDYTSASEWKRCRSWCDEVGSRLLASASGSRSWVCTTSGSKAVLECKDSRHLRNKRYSSSSSSKWFSWDFHGEFWLRCWSLKGSSMTDEVSELLVKRFETGLLRWIFFSSQFDDVICVLVDRLRARFPIITSGFARTSVNASTRRFPLLRLWHFATRIARLRTSSRTRFNSTACDLRWAWCNRTRSDGTTAAALLWLTRHDEAFFL